MQADFLRRLRSGMRVFRWYRRGVRNAQFRARQKLNQTQHPTIKRRR